MDGWIKLHRKILDNPVVCKDSDYAAVWMYLLLNATHKEYPAVFAGEKIMLQPGQLLTGRKAISEKFNIHESKVQRILKSFEIEQQIEQQTSNKKRLISILSWSDYQSDEQQTERQMNNKRTTNEQQMNTNKNVKNKRTEEIKDIFEFWNSLEIIRHRELTQKMTSKINARLESRTLEEITQALTNYQTVLNSELYWWSHKFTLDKLMEPKNLDQFLSDNKPFETFIRQKGGGNGGEYRRGTAGNVAANRKDASRNEELFFGTPGKDTKPLTDEFIRMVNNFE